MKALIMLLKIDSSHLTRAALRRFTEHQWQVKLALGFCLLFAAVWAHGQMPVYGDYGAHDPSRMIKCGNRYYLYITGPGIMGKYTTDFRNWTYGGQVFTGKPPSWTTNAVPGFAGNFWAPDIVLLNGLYYLYYSASSFGSNVSAIGLVTTTNLTSGPWIDQGAVIQSAVGSAYNCIDPCILLDTNGTMWMSFGSFWNGIYLVQLDPATGKRISPSSPLTRLAYNSSIEASFLYQHGQYYYLFVNWGACCKGIDSTYSIRLGRSTSVTGPYLDRNGVNLLSSGGSVFLESTARFIGPGHVGIMDESGTNWLTYHYYDGNNNGNATLGMGRLTWTSDGWPVLTNDWSAFYTFDVDAREHLNLYNGALQNGASATNETDRGNVLSLNGVSEYALLPNPVANASSFATWVKWDGGPSWQRIFDFGAGTGAYLFLTPRASSGRMRFAITTGGTGAERTIEAPTALPTNSWCHVAVTLDGSTGLLYLNGVAVATNGSVPIRPWQLLARTNYVGKSQFGADPAFSGKIDSLRIFSRPLNANEVRDIAWAPPGLAHRYSFTSAAWDSIGMAHGTLVGGALVTNNALMLPGTAGSYVNLPGGLLSGSSAATIAFWVNCGANGNWARVFDFGNISGSSGSQFLYFSPHTASGTHRIGISSGSTANRDASGVLDNRSVFVVCQINPTTGYTAIYTNGVLETAGTNTLPALSSISTAWSFLGRSLFSSDAWLNATIDELRIYDGQLTPEQIAADYQFGPDALALPVSLTQASADSGLSLSWPSYAVGFVPMTSPALEVGAVWSPLRQPTVLRNGFWQTLAPVTNPAAFFRLQR
jgi:arabinan endo-1,5-alpha-L-arabinosidase